MSNRRTTSVLISGGGVAGPALAFWLRQYGFEPTIVERAPRPRRCDVGGNEGRPQAVAESLIPSTCLMVLREIASR